MSALKNTYRTDLKQAGKKQAITNTFLRLNTRPEEYEPDPVCAGFDTSHCELCGNKIDYSFKLIHPKDPDFSKGKSLIVGSDCIIHFAEIYMPTRMNQFLAKIKASTEETKAKKFKKENPNLLEDMKSLEELLRTYDKSYPWNPLKRFKNIKEFYKNKRHLIRHQYLSKPKVASFYEIKKESNLWVPFLELWHARVRLQKGIKTEEDKKLSPEFYRELEVFGKSLNYYPSDLALTPLEKLLFLEQLEEFKKEKALRKQNFSKEVLKYGKLYSRAFNQGLEGSYWSLLAAFRPLSYYQLKSLLEPGEAFNEAMDNFQGPLVIENPKVKEIYKDLALGPI